MSWLDDGLGGARVLITGATGGIGRAVDAAFVAAGARTVASDLQPESSPNRPGSVEFISADLRIPSDCERLVGQASSALGGLDVAVHLAGILRRRDRLDAVTEEDWDVQHDVNLKATFFLLRSAGDIMVRQGKGGRLIAATSQGWWSGGYGGSVVYAASKGGVVSLCRGLARTYGPAGITVNTVAPGAIDTNMLTADMSPEVLRSTVESTPLGRLGTPAEVAGVVVFLASARASFVTAATVNVSGGWLAY